MPISILSVIAKTLEKSLLPCITANIQNIPTKQNNITLNPDKTTCTLFTPDPAEYKSNLDLKINNTTHGNAPNGSGPYLRPKTHI